MTSSDRGVLGGALLAAWLASALAAAATDAELSAAVADAAERRGLAQVEQIGALDGIPMHRITVPTLADDALGIRIDGELDDAAWAAVPPHDRLLVAVPATGRPGRHPTDVRLIATERGLYVGATLYQDPSTLVMRRSVRDLQMDRDTFGITLDTSGEGKFGYWFTLALGDSVQDGKVLPERNYSTDWDGTWIGRTARRSDGWSAELFLPWSMMALPNVDRTRTVGFAITRQVSHENARYQWPGHAYSSPQFVTALNHMHLDGVAPRPERSAIPFAAYTRDRAHDDDDLRVGVDLTWKPSPAAEFAATVLPDFGNVEADDVVLNLTAQETFFPEKRLFFLEGSEVFDTSTRASPGSQQRFTTNENYATTSRRVFMTSYQPAPISLFNTRRIGGTPTQVPVPPGVQAEPGELALPTELYGALKMTGSAGAIRYGVLGAMEEDVSLRAVDGAGDPAHIRADGRDFGAVRMVYEHVGAARASLGYLGTAVQGPLYDAYAHGVDGRYVSAGGRWNVESLMIATDRADVHGYAAQLDVQYSPDSRRQHRFSLDYFDEDVNFNDLGFLARNDYSGGQYTLLYARPNTGGRFTDIRGTVIANAKVSVSEQHLVDGGVYWRNSMVLPGRNTLRTGLGFRPAGHEDRDSRGNGAYRTDDRIWSEVLLTTSASRAVSWSFTAGAEQENLGDWTYLGGAGLTWRAGEGMSLDLDLSYRDRGGWVVYQGGRNFGRFEAEELSAKIKFNWFITAAHQIGLTAQWVGARAEEDGFFAVPPGDGGLVPAARTRPNHDFTVSLITVQARYRWEIAPLTDLYLVYNRSGALPNQVDARFGSLLSDVYGDPIVDSVVLKLRWRFAN
ncbi:MAG: DUF5916 domain-containing protein [Pseudomonadales bacterium]